MASSQVESRLFERDSTESRLHQAEILSSRDSRRLDQARLKVGLGSISLGEVSISLGEVSMNLGTISMNLDTASQNLGICLSRIDIGDHGTLYLVKMIQVHQQT
ncbi:hypothetical protein BD408DRAFT_437101 [Parasitella parasitica]|nr:hypothetical protein BD408DRAFT_437101 [Parasitella parasitica]